MPSAYSDEMVHGMAITSEAWQLRLDVENLKSEMEYQRIVNDGQGRRIADLESRALITSIAGLILALIVAVLAFMVVA